MACPLLSRLLHLFFLPAATCTNEPVSLRLWVLGSDPQPQCSLNWAALSWLKAAKKIVKQWWQIDNGGHKDLLYVWAGTGCWLIEPFSAFYEYSMNDGCVWWPTASCHIAADKLVNEGHIVYLRWAKIRVRTYIGSLWYLNRPEIACTGNSCHKSQFYASLPEIVPPSTGQTWNQWRHNRGKTAICDVTALKLRHSLTPIYGRECALAEQVQGSVLHHR